MKHIPNSRPYLDSEDRAAVQEVLLSGDLAAGADIEAFESEFAAYVGMSDAVAVSSGFAALHLALLAVDIRPGDEVIVTCVSTCAAIRDAILAVGATPIFVDTEASTFNLCSDSVKAAMSPRIRAIVCPHHTGIVADLDTLTTFGVPVIEDCSQALGAEYRGRPVGSFGTVATFSFYPTKMLTTIDGGAVTSRDPEIARRVRDLRYYGGKWDSLPRYNYKMQNLHAALGRRQLGKLPFFLDRRQQIGQRYRQTVIGAGLSERACLHRDGYGIYFSFALRVSAEGRDELLRVLRSQAVPCRTEVGFLCPDPGRYPAARQLSAETITFPTYPSLTDPELDEILGGLDSALRAFAT